MREARKTIEPDPVKAARLAEQAGAHGITVHLREDRRHIQDRDVERLRKAIRTRMNLEMAATEEMIAIALEIGPDQVSLVPEKRLEITTEGGLDVDSQKTYLKQVRKRIKSGGIRFSLFVDPETRQVEAAAEVGADSIEINTGLYSELREPRALEEELVRIQKAARAASRAGLQVFAGHGLTLENVGAIAAIPEIEELNIGHSIVAQSIYHGMDPAVRAMVDAIEKGRALRTSAARAVK